MFNDVFLNRQHNCYLKKYSLRKNIFIIVYRLRVYNWISERVQRTTGKLSLEKTTGVSLSSTRSRKWVVMAACREILALGTDAVSAATVICPSNCKTNSASLVRQTFDVPVSYTL